MLPSMEKVHQDLYRFVQYARQRILDYKPDLVIVLANGGWAPYRALLTLWQELDCGQFPPTLVTNLGREKMDRFEEFYKRLPSPHRDYLHGEHSPYEEVGYFLNWLTKQTDWLEQLKLQIEAAIGVGVAPEKVIILDDCYHEGNTFYLVAGLLKAIYPNVNYLFIAPLYYEWRIPLAEEWLNQQNVVIPEEDKREFKNALFQFVPGTQDVSADSLEWKPVTSDNPYLPVLTKYLPAGKWFELPEKIYAEIEAEIRRRARNNEPLEKDGTRIAEHSGFDTEILIFKLLWEQGQITRQQIMERFGLTGYKADYHLDRRVKSGEILPQRNGRSLIYVPSPYLTMDEPDNGFLHNAYWLIPGKLMIGHKPNQYSEKDTSKCIEELIAIGIDQLISMLSSPDADEEKYRQLVDKVAKEHESSLEIKTISIPEGEHPSKEDLISALDFLDLYLESEHVYYLYDEDNTDRAALIAGCWLVRHGLNGKEALLKLSELRKDTYQAWHRSPNTLLFRRMIKRWPVGQ